MRISWSPEDQAAFDEVKRRLSSGLKLQRFNPDKPFVFRVDASQFAVGTTLEQLIDESRKPTIEDVRKEKNCPGLLFVSEVDPWAM